jgi:integral membrane protein (TIGR01906 family)
MAAIGGFVGLSFLTFFESFHAIFFQGDSWRFLYSDTLIRLFPLRFWQDAVIFLLVFVALLGLLMGVVLRPGKPKGS